MVTVQFKANLLSDLSKFLKKDADRFTEIRDKIRYAIKLNAEAVRANNEFIVGVSTDANMIVQIYEFLSVFADGLISEFNEAMYAALSVQIQAGITADAITQEKEPGDEGFISEWLDVYSGVQQIRNYYTAVNQQESAKELATILA